MARPITRYGRILIPLVIALVLFAPVLHATTDGGSSGDVRGLDPAAQALIIKARTASATVAALVLGLESTDLIVMVQVTLIPDTLGGDTHLLAVTPVNRILLVRVHAARSPDTQMEFLGHELQHAMEVSTASSVRDEAALAGLMVRIGRQTGAGTYETDAALRVGRQIRRELAGAGHRNGG